MAAPDWFVHFHERVEGAPRRPGPTPEPDADPGRFLAIATRLAGVLVVAWLFRIEEQRGLVLLAPLVFVGFLLHALLPLAWRGPCFLLLSLFAYALALGPAPAGVLAAVGFALVGLCHLPLAFGGRVALVAAAGAGLAALHAGFAQVPFARVVLPILGAMFGFRMIVYLYDLRHERRAVAPWQRLSYFFLLPNCLFPLFPVVDYATFLRTYYDAPPETIYRTGVNRIFRGVTHILAYRAIYQHMALPIHEVRDLGSLVLYVLSGFLLYLRVSGIFHVIVGILCLFGFHLPETNDRYLLASGFNDFWRRANIYWKDFMQKVFYYPAFMRLRRRGMTFALVVATAAVFVATWLLHSVQWFWVYGEFPLRRVDAIFWGVFGACVLANSLWQARRGRRRSLRARAFSPREALERALRTLGMGLFIFLAWSFWMGSSASELGDLLATAATSPPWQFGLLGLALAALVALGVLVQWLPSRFPALGGEPEDRERRRTLGTTAGILALLVVGALPHLGASLPSWLPPLLDERLSARDDELLERGYYEDLLGSQRLSSQLWVVQGQRPEDWLPLEQTPAARPTGDVLEKELLPSRETPFRGALLRTNRFGLRDREYALAKPPGTLRIAVLGGSVPFGSGVGNDEVFEELVEERLERERPAGPETRFELVNFALGGSTLVQFLAILEQRVPAFAPDACLLVSHASDARRALASLSRLMHREVPLGDPFLEGLRERTGVVPGMDRAEVMRRLSPRRYEVVAWAYRRIAETCRGLGAIPLRAFVPLPAEKLKDREEMGREGLRVLADEAGFRDLDLGDVYGARNRKALIVAPFDLHPNAAGHALVADALYAALVRNLDALGLAPDRG